MQGVATTTGSTKTSLGQRLDIRARERWPRIQCAEARFRARFVSFDVWVDEDGKPVVQKLCRLRSGDSASIRGFTICGANHDDYGELALPTGFPVGSAEDALDTACDL